jgi:anti-sigma regulatory factor (Ser/Thr protein kinase)
MSGVAGRVELRLPGAPAFVRFARLVASGLAGDCGFTVEEVDELRIAVDELVHVLIDSAPACEVALVYTVDDDATITVEGSRPGGMLVPLPDPLAEEILGAATDAWRLWANDSGVRFELVKRRRYPN